jgi:hypothetical protein
MNYINTDQAITKANEIQAVFNFKANYMAEFSKLPTPSAIAKATGLKKAKVERILDEGLDYDFIKGIYAGCEVKLMNILFQKAQAGDTPSIKHFLEMSGFISTKEEVKPGLQIEIKYVDSKREGE